MSFIWFSPAGANRFWSWSWCQTASYLIGRVFANDPVEFYQCVNCVFIYCIVNVLLLWTGTTLTWHWQSYLLDVPLVTVAPMRNNGQVLLHKSGFGFDMFRLHSFMVNSIDVSLMVLKTWWQLVAYLFLPEPAFVVLSSCGTLHSRNIPLVSCKY